MIQRKQTVFLFLGALISLVCLCMPLGYYIDTTNHALGQQHQLFNLWIANADGGHDYSVCPLALVLFVAMDMAVYNIFLFKNRMVQSKICLFNILLIIGWYAVLALYTFVLNDGMGTFKPGFAIILAAVSLILYVMARKAILADEALVRAADRIR